MEKRRDYAPIVIFGFNRLEPLKACVEALLANSEAKDTDLFVFVDGPREGNPDEAKKVAKVRDYAASITGFLSLHTYFSDVNKKLGPSIIAGVSKVLDQYERAIVMEDDLVCGKNYLSFMNQCLDYYENKENVFSVCGYSNAVKTPANYPYDAYFCPRSASTGWATWRDRWQSVDWQLDDWTAVKRNARAFNHWGGSDCYSMLRGWKEGINQSWAIRFCYSQFVQNRLSVFPTTSHILNIGFNGEGTNCKKWSRFKYEFDTSERKDFAFPPEVQTIPSIKKSFLAYHGYLARAYSRLMYMVHRS